MPPADATTQPAWVVIVLAVLALLGTIGVAFLTSRAGKSATQGDGGQATLAEGAGVDPTAVVLQSALEHLARVADREAAESEEARRETATLRQKLEAAQDELLGYRERVQRAEADLAACRAHAEILSRQAFHRGEHG